MTIAYRDSCRCLCAFFVRRFNLVLGTHHRGVLLYDKPTSQKRAQVGMVFQQYSNAVVNSFENVALTMKYQET
jgi:ABC-type phosphate transport system ATPase subunit